MKITSREKFFEILSRHGLPDSDLKTMTVVMSRRFFGGKSKVTFYGVEKLIPAEVETDIRVEVFPLILVENPNTEILVSAEILPLGEPDRRQKAWNSHCDMFNASF